MCLPALALASAGIAALGQGISAYSSYQQHGYEAKVANQNAKLSNAQALDAITRGQEEDRRNQQQTGRTIGSERAAMAANGVDITYGNAADVVGDTAMFGAEDSATIRANAMREAHGYEINAANFRSTALAARRAATGALISGAFGIAQTALGGASQFKSLSASGGGGFSGAGAGSGW